MVRTIVAGLLERPCAYQVSLVVGTGCMLAVLMTALSGIIATKGGMSYTDPRALILTLCFYAAMLLLFPLARRSWFRKALVVISVALCIVWMSGMGVVMWTGAVDLSGILQVLFGFVPRASGVLLAILWNLHFCMQRPLGAVRMVVCSVLLSTALFLLVALAQGAAGILAFGVLSLVSAALCLHIEVTQTSNVESPYSIEQVERFDDACPAEPASVKRTRMLYFGSRALYGFLAGLVIGVVSIASGGGAEANVVVALLSVVTLFLMACGVLVLRSGLSVHIGWLLGTPFVVVTLVVGCFADTGAGMASLLAMLIEIVWNVQLYAQLPSYRTMARMNPAVFAWIDKSVAMVLYMGAVNLVDAVVPPNAVGPGFAIALSGGCLAFVVVFAVASLMRHVARYYPLVCDDKPARQHGLALLEAVEHVAEEYGFTPKEREVAYYLALGYSRPYIGKVLYIAGGTVKIHAHHIYQKLGVSSQDELIELVQKVLGLPGPEFLQRT